jgi:hypothetical protein
MKKTRGQKSRVRVPLSIKAVENLKLSNNTNKSISYFRESIPVKCSARQFQS